jgi:hypothetical protein
LYLSQLYNLFSIPPLIQYSNIPISTFFPAFLKSLKMILLFPTRPFPI